MTARHLLAVAACFFNSIATGQADNLNWSSRKIQLSIQRDHSDAPVPTGISIREGTDELAVVGDDHLVRIKSRSTGKLIRLFDTHSDWIKIAKYHPNGETLFTAGDDHSIFVWNADNSLDYSRFATEDRAIEGMAIDPEGELLATVGFNNKLNIYDIFERKLVRTLQCPCQDMRAIQFSPNGALLAIGGRNGIVRVIEVDSGAKIMDLAAHKKRIRDLVFVNDQTIVTCSDDQTLGLIAIDSNRSSTLLQANTKFYSVASLGANRIAVGSSDNLIRIVDLTTRSESGILKGHSGTVCELISDGNELISGGFDTEIRVWQIETSFVKGRKSDNSVPRQAKAVRAKGTGTFRPASNRSEIKAAQLHLPKRIKQSTPGYTAPGKTTSNQTTAPTNSSFVVPRQKPNVKPDNKAFNFSKSGFQIVK